MPRERGGASERVRKERQIIDELRNETEIVADTAPTYNEARKLRITTE